MRKKKLTKMRVLLILLTVVMIFLINFRGIFLSDDAAGKIAATALTTQGYSNVKIIAVDR